MQAIDQASWKKLWTAWQRAALEQPGYLVSGGLAGNAAQSRHVRQAQVFLLHPDQVFGLEP